MATKAKPREDQPGLDGIADEYNKRVHSAAKHYAKMRDARMEATEYEDAAKTKLIEIMHEESLETYSCRDVDICLEKKEGIKVKIGDKSAKDEPEGEE